MATQHDDAPENLEKMNANLARVEELSQRLIQALSAKNNPANPTLNGPGQDLFAKAAVSYWSEVLENPGTIYETQLGYWGKSVRHFMEAQQMLLTGAQAYAPGEAKNALPDKRFSNPLWETNPYFNYVKEQYFLNAEAIRAAAVEVDGLDEKDKQRLAFFAQQIIDMMSPTNFLGTNPDALERAVETEGESLVKGLENLISDLEANNGEMIVRLADDTAFELGGNIATTPGEVVFHNEMMELIQYAPATDEVFATPIVMFPPWINKFYILDLTAQNSMIKWITEQGYTLFMVSWVNPDKSHADVGIEDYITDGYLKAFEVTKAITGQKQVNAVGYCIAGTTLCLTLALMKARGDKSVKSATLFTTLTDFSEQGEFTPFLQNDFIDGIEAEVAEQGILRSFIMGRTMSYLRSKDLIYSPAIRSYMLGEAPPAFDLLYWNGDGANLPGRMTTQYLRGLCQQNAFAEDGFALLDTNLKLSDVDVPLLAVTCQTDHIAAWKDCYRGVQQMGAKDRTFVLSESGHIAGIVNPPSKKKYSHYTNSDLTGAPDAWLEGAVRHDGSWWPLWEAWLRKRSGKKVAARIPGDSDYKLLEPAPGSYVRIKARI